jgi:hypothetical protein
LDRRRQHKRSDRRRPVGGARVVTSAKDECGEHQKTNDRAMGGPERHGGRAYDRMTDRDRRSSLGLSRTSDPPNREWVGHFARLTFKAVNIVYRLVPFFAFAALAGCASGPAPQPASPDYATMPAPPPPPSTPPPGVEPAPPPTSADGTSAPPSPPESLPAAPSSAPQYAPVQAYSPPVAQEVAPPASQWVYSYPTGQWVYTTSYGWVWVPAGTSTTAVEDVPYAYLYTPAYGWTWYVSPWGGGPYRYGAWVRRPWVPHGWRGAWVARPHVVVHLGHRGHRR